MDLALTCHSHSRPQSHHQQSHKPSIFQSRNSQVLGDRESGQSRRDGHNGKMQCEWTRDLVWDQLRPLPRTQRIEGHSLGIKHQVHTTHTLLARSCLALRWQVALKIERGAEICGKLLSDKHWDRRQSLPVHFFLIVTLLNKKDHHLSPSAVLSFFTSLAWELC